MLHYLLPLIFLPFFSFSEEKKSEKNLLKKEELQIREVFPQYKMTFDHKAVQEEVHKQFLKELKEKEKSN